MENPPCGDEDGVEEAPRNRPAWKRVPLMGRRLKWITALLTTAVVLGLLIEHWWTQWVRHGLGW